MFTLKSFIEAIQAAILSANDTLMDKNLEVLNRYFEKDDDDGELQKRIDEALEATGDVIESESNKVSRKSFSKAIESLKDLRKVMNEDDVIDQALAQSDIRPKTVILNYPVKNNEGQTVNKEVHVPLITLVPVTFSKVEELKLQADLELNLIDDEVHVGLGKFSGSNRKTSDDDTGEGSRSNSGSVGSVELTIKPQEISDGMQEIIDAYEKVLKAQLPH